MSLNGIHEARNDNGAIGGFGGIGKWDRSTIHREGGFFLSLASMVCWGPEALLNAQQTGYIHHIY